MLHDVDQRVAFTTPFRNLQQIILFALIGHLLTSSCAGFTLRPAHRSMLRRTVCRSNALLETSWFDNIFHRLLSDMDMHVTDLDTYDLNSGSAKVETCDSNLETNVAHLSSLQLVNAGCAVASIQAFVGPKSDVPHFVARCTRRSRDVGGEPISGLDVHIDFLPRLDAQYDAPREPDGSFSPPTSREGFAAAGVRNKYASDYFSAEAEDWKSNAVASFPPSSNPEPREYVEISHHGACTGLLIGPLLTELQLPDTPEGAAAATRLCTEAAGYWLRWMKEQNEKGNQASASQAGWLTSRMIYARDCQVRNQLYASAVCRFVDSFLDEADAISLAQAEAGPIDMVGHNSLGLGREDS